ncbi:MAG TPA: GNAT family N-acetyltransferase [Pseudonocardiaceae bacterium]|nr:GNAT family N-acetyltransferase [Pseudonocardiaceae bacterium]
MPILIEPARCPGSLGEQDQPRLDVDDDLALRPWRPDDASQVRAAFESPEIQRWHVRRMDSDAEAREWIARWPVRWAEEIAASWAIVDTATDRAVGQVGMRDISLFDASADLSYWVLPEARGRGVAPRATLALTRWAFHTLRLHRLGLRHSTRNEASCRVAGKAGFAFEGTMRESVRHADGWHDMHVHARVRD